MHLYLCDFTERIRPQADHMDLSKEKKKVQEDKSFHALSMAVPETVFQIPCFLKKKKKKNPRPGKEKNRYTYVLPCSANVQ